MRLLPTLAAVLFLVAPCTAKTQGPSQNGRLTCLDFYLKIDHAWRAYRPLRVRGNNGYYRIEPYTPIPAGVSFAGHDLTTLLDEKCK